jgi:sporulation protein YlmC with PRC-barrel domain
MRLKELRGLPVIDPTAARKIGTVTDYQVDPVSGRLAALDIDGVENRGAERILAQRIRRVGRSAVILTSRGGASPGTTIEINERWLDTATLVGLDVMGDDGNRIGHLIDAAFDQDSLQIETYLLRASLWEQLLGRRSRIPPVKIHACSRELMIVTTGHLRELPTATTPLEDTTPLGLHVSLKAEDRPREPIPEPVQEREPVAAQRS